MHDTAPHIGSDLSCVQCDYSLRGLPAEGVCPECGRHIQDSIAHEALLAASAPPPLPAWLRIYRSSQLTAIGALIAAPLALPYIAQIFNLPDAGRRSAFWEAHSACSTIVAISGFLLALLLAQHKRPTQSAVIIFLSFCWCILMPG